MADPEVRVEATPTEDTPADDAAMADDGDEAETKAGDGEEVSTLPQAEAPKRTTFLECEDFTSSGRCNGALRKARRKALQAPKSIY